MKKTLLIVVLAFALLVAGCPRKPSLRYDDRLNKPPPWTKNLGL